MRKPNKPLLRYSGPASMPFWNQVNRIKEERVRLRMYRWGVRLQNLEHMVFKMLEADGEAK